MDIRIERRRLADRVVVLGLVDDRTIVFRVDVRRWVSSARFLGEDLGVPVVEIAELEILPNFRGARTAFRALCEGLTEALILSDAQPQHVIAAIPDNPNVLRRLQYRREFRQLGELPWPFVAAVEDILVLRDRVCR